MLEHLGIKRVELRVVDVGLYNALFEVVEADRVRRAVEPRERFFVQLAPDLTRRIPDRFAKRAAAVAQLPDKQTRSPMLSRMRIARKRALTVIDLRFLARLGLEPTADLRIARSQFADEVFDRRVKRRAPCYAKRRHAGQSRRCPSPDLTV